jgi:hypothetical protein
MRRCRARLEDCRQVSTELGGFQNETTYIREALSTANVLTLMWFFTSVGANMNGQRTPLNEAFATAWSHARVGALICVDSIMSLKIGLSVKTLDGDVSDCFKADPLIMLTLLHVCQSHWNGRALGSFSTNSMTSILTLFAAPGGD